MEAYELLVNNIEKGDIEGTQNILKKLLTQGQSPKDIIQNGLVVALDEVGRRYSSGECFLPEMLIAARASQKGLEILRPLFAKSDYKATGRMVIGTVKGDVHDIGKNIVIMTFESAGFDVVDLGSDVPPERFIEAIETSGPDILGLSCLLTTTMQSISLTIQKVIEAGLRDKVTVIIGGPPTSPEFAEEVGADYYGENAYKGVEIARQVVTS